MYGDSPDGSVLLLETLNPELVRLQLALEDLVLLLEALDPLLHLVTRDGRRRRHDGDVGGAGDVRWGG